MVKTEDVGLGTLKFARPKPRQPTDYRQPKLAQPSAADGQATSYEPSASVSRPLPSEQYAAQTSGSELTPEAPVWQMYVEEAKEYDDELVKSENENLDLMLLFAALFSAILTAFIIESKNLLQPDSAEISATLLLTIAQSLQRIEQGSPQTMPPIQLTPFAVPASARWINGLWFTSLALSLAAALVAMLAKEWLNAFTSSRPRPPHAYVLLHQDRLQGLVQWGALHMINLLPSMLHMSLLLFSIGLAVYLWTLDSGVAIAEVVVTSGTLCFYAITAMLGAVYNYCPFVTQISKYLRVILGAIPQNRTQSTLHIEPQKTILAKETTEKELQALLWLIENTRDPQISDYACQALAGLQVPNSPLYPEAPDTGTQETQTAPRLEEEKAAAANNPIQEMSNYGPAPLSSNYVTVLVGLHEALCARILQAQQQVSQEPAEYRGLNMAELVNAVPTTLRVLGLGAIRESQVIADIEHLGYKAVAAPVFSALDFIWSGACPELTPDVYVSFAAADLGVIVATVLTWHRGSLTQPKQETDLHHKAPDVHPRPSDGDSAIPPHDPDVRIDVKTKPLLNSTISLFELRARYARNLVRIDVFLYNHVTGILPINSRALTRLLNWIRSAAILPELNTEQQLSTHWAQSQATPETIPDFNLVTTPGSYYFMTFPWVGSGIIAQLVQLLSDDLVENVPSLEISVGRVLQVLGPMILKQWVNMVIADPNTGSDRYRARLSYVAEYLQYWPEDRAENQFERLRYWILKQLLIIATIAISLGNYPGVGSLASFALEALRRRASTGSGQPAIIELAQELPNVTSDMIRHTSLNHSSVIGSSAESILELCAIRHLKSSFLARRSLQARNQAHILRLVSNTDVNVDRTRQILADLKELAQRDKALLDSDTYSKTFIQDPENFAALAAMAQEEKYLSLVQDFTADVVDFIHDIIPWNDHDQMTGLIPPAVVPSYLKAMFIVGHGIPETGAGRLKTFLSHILDIFEQFGHEAKGLAIKHPETSPLFRRLVPTADQDNETKDILSRFEKWNDWDSWIMERLPQLLEDSDDRVRDFMSNY